MITEGKLCNCQLGIYLTSTSDVIIDKHLWDIPLQRISNTDALKLNICGQCEVSHANLFINVLFKVLSHFLFVNVLNIPNFTRDALVYDKLNNTTCIYSPSSKKKIFICFSAVIKSNALIVSNGVEHYSYSIKNTYVLIITRNEKNQYCISKNYILFSDFMENNNDTRRIIKITCGIFQIDTSQPNVHLRPQILIVNHIDDIFLYQVLNFTKKEVKKSCKKKIILFSMLTASILVWSVSVIMPSFSFHF